MKLKKTITYTLIGLISAVTAEQALANNHLNPSGQIMVNKTTVDLSNGKHQESQNAQVSAKEVSDWAFDSLADVAPPPANYVLKLFKLFIPGPSVDETQTLTYKKLEQIEAKVNSSLSLSQNIQADITELSSKLMSYYFNDDVLSRSNIIDQVNNRYSAFYADKIFPRGFDDFYSYAEQTCQGGTCSDAEANIIKRLNGQPKYQSIQKNMINDPQILSLYELEQTYEKSLKSTNSWQSLQEKYESLLNEDNKNNPDKMVNYLAARKTIFQLQADYFTTFDKLYNIMSMQLAFYYAHPEFFKGTGSDPQMLPIFDGVTEKGEKGYQQAQENLKNYFIERVGKGQLQRVFGKSREGKRIIHLTSGSTYINNYLQTFSHNTFENFIDEKKRCEPVSLYMPNNQAGRYIGRLTTRCQIDNFDDADKSTSYNLKGIDIPYRIGDNGQVDFFGYKDIQYNPEKQAYTATPNGQPFIGNKTPMQYSEAGGYGDSDMKKDSWVSDYYVAADMYLKGSNNLFLLKGFKDNATTFQSKSESESAIIYWAHSSIFPERYINQNFGWGFNLDYERIMYNQYRDDTDSGYHFFGLTKNGHLFVMNTYFQEDRVTGDGVRFFCYLDDPNCKANDSHTLLHWKDGTRLGAKNKNKFNQYGFPYMNLSVFNISSLPTYVVPENYITWQQSHGTDDQFKNRIYLDGTVSYSLVEGDEDVTLLETEKGQSTHQTRLIYLAPKEDGSSGKIEIQVYIDNQWVLAQSYSNSKYPVSTDGLFDGNVKKVTFEDGDIKVYTANDDKNPVWSISQQYAANNKGWHVDPYAYVTLDGTKLVVKGSEIDSNGKPVNNVIWDSQSERSKFWSKINTVIKGSYIQSCDNIKWNHWNDSSLSAVCKGQKVTLNYYKQCAELSTVSFDNGKLVCDTPK